MEKTNTCDKVNIEKVFFTREQIEEYKKSYIYSKINEKNMSYFIQLVNSFENFKPTKKIIACIE